MVIHAQTPGLHSESQSIEVVPFDSPCSLVHSTVCLAVKFRYSGSDEEVGPWVDGGWSGGGHTGLVGGAL